MSAFVRDEVKVRIKKILVERLKLDRLPETIGDQESLFGPDGLGLDSIDALELVLGVEQEFGVKIENEEVGTEALGSVEKLTEFVLTRNPGIVDTPA
jgi:acyl carrier protein